MVITSHVPLFHAEITIITGKELFIVTCALDLHRPDVLAPTFKLQDVVFLQADIHILMKTQRQPCQSNTNG